MKNLLNACNRELDYTTNSAVYKKLYKQKNADCSYCKWHGPGSENDSWEYYYFYRSSFKIKRKIYKSFLNPESRRSSIHYTQIHEGDGKYPSWKLVSKNKKQWMNKPLKFREFYPEKFMNISEFNGRIEILWNTKRIKNWKKFKTY